MTSGNCQHFELEFCADHEIQCLVSLPHCTACGRCLYFCGMCELHAYMGGLCQICLEHKMTISLVMTDGRTLRLTNCPSKEMTLFLSSEKLPASGSKKESCDSFGREHTAEVHSHARILFSFLVFLCSQEILQ